MEVTQEILLPVLLAAIVANTVILLLVVVAARQPSAVWASGRDGSCGTCCGGRLQLARAGGALPRPGLAIGTGVATPGVVSVVLRAAAR